MLFIKVYRRGCKIGTIILYHGTPDYVVNPVFGGGDDKHDSDANKVTNVFSTLFER